MRSAGMIAIAAIAAVACIGISGAQQRIGVPRLPGPTISPAQIRGFAPAPLSPSDVAKAFQRLTETTTTPVPQAKYVFSALHPRDGAAYAVFTDVDILGGQSDQMLPSGAIVMKGTTSRGGFSLPNSLTKSYLIDCSVGGPNGPPLSIRYGAGGVAPVTNGHALYVLQRNSGPGMAVFSGAGGSDNWYLFSCEATLMG